MLNGCLASSQAKALRRNCREMGKTVGGRRESRADRLLGDL